MKDFVKSGESQNLAVMPLVVFGQDSQPRQFDFFLCYDSRMTIRKIGNDKKMDIISDNLRQVEKETFYMYIERYRDDVEIAEAYTYFTNGIHESICRWVFKETKNASFQRLDIGGKETFFMSSRLIPVMEVGNAGK